MGKGRGAVSNPSGRYERHARAAFDDGWGTADEPPPRLETTVIVEQTRTILARNDSPDVPFDRSINPYRGCEHGCIYCFARPTHAYLGFSPGLDFESRLVAKPEAPECLARELSQKGYLCRPIAIGANTDPYQPLERKLEITRRLLEVLLRFKHPVGVVTKSNLVLRDLDLLEALARERLVKVMISLTTLDRSLARVMEPRAPTPAKRLEAMRSLADRGVPVGVLASPMIPAINDPELERILEAAAEAGAESAGYILIRLPGEVKTLFLEWLETHFPEKRARVLSTLKAMHGGSLYDPAFGTRMSGRGRFAELLAWRYSTAVKRLGLRKRGDETLDTTRFVRPGDEQLGLFGA